MLQAKVTELALATIPGNTSRGNTGYSGGPVISHWPTLISSNRIEEKVYIDERSNYQAHPNFESTRNILSESSTKSGRSKHSRAFSEH